MVDELAAGGAWHPDPLGRYPQRWWSGVDWTDQVISPEGAVVIDPLGVVPGPADATRVLPSPSPFPPPPQFPPPPATGPPPTTYAPGYPPPASGQPGAWPGSYPMPAPTGPKSSGMAIASMVLGIGAFLVALIPFFGFASVPFALIGLGLGIAGASRASKGHDGKGMAITGIVMSLAALAISVLWFIAFVGFAAESDGVNTDPSNGICNPDRFMQDPDC